ncbi:MAG: phosphatidylglycerophosphatase A [Wenzhouxiangellaceae bacterium]|nr:phosphatidylglycerophosphatase A [Wenzhouxiangellaceae bacterium]
MTAPDRRTDRRTVVRVALATPSGFLAFGLGSGLSPVAPGTAGTLAGMLLALPLIGLPTGAAVAVALLVFVAGVPICNRASRALGVHDHGGIVIDEIAAIWLVLALMPADWRWWLAAFVLFRVFDVLKPWPIGWLDRRVHGGLGIMLDDLVAALFALALLGPAMAWFHAA